MKLVEYESNADLWENGQGKNLGRRLLKASVCGIPTCLTIARTIDGICGECRSTLLASPMQLDGTAAGGD